MKENQKIVPLQKKKPERVHTLPGMVGKTNLFRHFYEMLFCHMVGTAEAEG